ncbi:MAG: sulfotransferase [Verrucomicrobiota bacterium]
MNKKINEFESPESLEYLKDGLAGKHAALADRFRPALPTFIIIGAAKAGTTSLGVTLQRHPQIQMSFPKEPKFFGRFYYKGWKWYAKCFAKGDHLAPVRGEASTMYASKQTLFEHSPKLMKLYLPDVKLIYLTRHPLDRIVSHWRHWKGRKPGFVDFNKIYNQDHAEQLIIGCSKYYERISAFRAEFDDNQILPLTLEDMENDPATTLRRVLEFISADPDVNLLENGQLSRVNTAEEGRRNRVLVPTPEWRPKFKKRVIEDLREDTGKFLEWMGKPRDFWDLEKT